MDMIDNFDIKMKYNLIHELSKWLKYVYLGIEQRRPQFIFWGKYKQLEIFVH